MSIQEDNRFPSTDRYVNLWYYSLQLVKATMAAEQVQLTGRLSSAVFVAYKH